mgnify:CR=1 FL=1
MAKKTFPIKYTSREFSTIKSDLIDYVQRYYSDVFQDFNEASFGALMLDTVSYVGDILSFYLDYQTNESFIDTATEFDNVLRLGKQFGYKYRQNQVSYGEVSLYILVPAQGTGVGPDTDYLPMVMKNTTFSSAGGGIFTLNENVDFSNSNNEIVVARADSVTGNPTFYAVKTKGQIISGELQEEQISVGGYQKFFRAELASPNLTEILSVHDAEGHEYFEVDYLSQNIIYRSLINRNSDSDEVSSVLKAYPVARRFVVDQEKNRTFLQFGHGSDSEIFNDPIADPSEILLKVHGKDYVADASFDPSNLVATDKFGVAPSDTTLTIVYRTNTVANSNAASNSIRNIINPVVTFKDRKSLLPDNTQTVIDSLEVTNEKRILGDVSTPTLSELKTRVKGTYAAQNRAVTQEDYMSVIYSMASEYGSIKRCNIVQDNDSFKRNINIYIVSEDENNKLVNHTQSLEDNLITWLNRYKMINDTIDILPAKIINFGIEFSVIGDLGINKYDVLSTITDVLNGVFERTFDIGEPLVISDLAKIINSVKGVVDTVDVKIVQKTGADYSDISFAITDNITADGRFLEVPADCILEVRHPANDIKGTIK